MPASAQWCTRHWQVVRESDLNGIALTLALMQALIDHPEFMRRVGPSSTAERQNAVLAELAPVCCLLGDEKMNALFEADRNSRRKS